MGPSVMVRELPCLLYVPLKLLHGVEPAASVVSESVAGGFGTASTLLPDESVYLLSTQDVPSRLLPPPCAPEAALFEPESSPHAANPTRATSPTGSEIQRGDRITGWPARRTSLESPQSPLSDVCLGPRAPQPRLRGAYSAESAPVGQVAHVLAWEAVLRGGGSVRFSRPQAPARPGGGGVNPRWALASERPSWPALSSSRPLDDHRSLAAAAARRANRSDPTSFF